MKIKQLLSITSIIVMMMASLQALAESKAVRVVDDSVITTKIKAKMLADKTVSALNISVTTKNGVVDLSGTVDTEDEATKAIELASSTQDVKDVITKNLTVKQSKQPLSDAYITAKVKGMFLREKIFGDQDISVTGIKVETKDGVVHLSGKADNKEQIDEAKNLAKSVNGVTKVESTITLKQ